MERCPHCSVEDEFHVFFGYLTVHRVGPWEDGSSISDAFEYTVFRATGPSTLLLRRRMLCVTFVFAAALCRESKAMSGRGICYTNAGCDCYGTDCDTCHKSSVIIREISHILTRATFW